MKMKFIAMSLLCICPNLWANTAIVPQMTNSNNNIRIVTRPALVGLWSMSIPNNKKCVEYYNFKNNQDVFMKSAEEWSSGMYDYQVNLDANNSAALTINIQYENNKKDCSGIQEDQSGESLSVYIKWDNPSTIQFCNENNRTCFATLQRVLP